MVASREVEIQFYVGIGRRRGHRFGALAQVIGRTAISFLLKCILLAAKRVGADLLEFAVLEIADVVSGRNNIKTAAKSVGRQTLRNSWVKGAAGGSEVAGEGVRAESFQQNLQNKSVGREETFLQTFLTNHVE